MKNYFVIFLFLLSAVGFYFFYNSVLAEDNSVTMTVKISVCGNDEKEYGEECDGTDLGGATCSSRGFFNGTLSCSFACEYVISGCLSLPYCGDGICNGSETCSSCSADCGICQQKGGGGGGGSTIAPSSSVNFQGRAYPLSKVIILKDGQIAISTIAGPDAHFEVTLSGLSKGNFNFAVYGEDNKGLKSELFTFPVYTTLNVTTKISGIFIAPTIDVDKSQVEYGDNLAIFGQSSPSSEITILINSDSDIFKKTQSDLGGIYLYNFDTSEIEKGQHTTKSKAALNGEITSYSKSVSFAVGDSNIPTKSSKCPEKADLNNDCKVNLVDFSIAAYWYKRELSSSFKIIEKQYLNNDGKINLVDFSIMAYWWTG